jgi:hypothetical protein
MKNGYTQYGLYVWRGYFMRHSDETGASVG